MYKNFKAGKKSSITEAQIKKLDDRKYVITLFYHLSTELFLSHNNFLNGLFSIVVGMVWSILPSPAVTAERKSWEERFQDLLRYKEEHGHTRVPQSYPGLGKLKLK